MGTIIGGAIAAVIGAVAGLATTLIISRLNVKKRQSAVVDELLAEVQQNWQICTDQMEEKPKVRWWQVKFQTNAYSTYKASLSFLRKELRLKLAEVAYLIEPLNTNIDLYRSGNPRSTAHNPDAWEPIPSKLNKLKNLLLSCQNKLQDWQEEQHTPFWKRLQFARRFTKAEDSGVYSQNDALKKYVISQVPVYFFASFLFVRLISLSKAGITIMLPIVNRETTLFRSEVYITISMLLLGWALVLTIATFFAGKQGLLERIDKWSALPYWVVSILVFGYGFITNLIATLSAGMSNWYFYAFYSIGLLLLIMFTIQFIQSSKHRSKTMTD